MIISSSGRSADSDHAVLAPPAVSPRRSGHSRTLDAPSELLPPFVGSRIGRAARATDTGEPSVRDAATEQPVGWSEADLPIVSAMPIASAAAEPDELVAAGPEEPWSAVEIEEPSRSGGTEPELPPLGDEWSPETPGLDADGTLQEAEFREGETDTIALDEAVAASDSHLLEAFSLVALDDWSMAAAPVQDTPAEPVARVEEVAGEQPARGDAVAAPAQRVESALSEVLTGEDKPVLEEVAGRLERIASALREGRPIELFSAGSSDPLEVLIAGYALGYSEAYRRVSEERRTQRDGR